MTNTNTSKGLHIALWVVQSLLAIMFLMAGANKLFQSIPELAKMLPWVTQVPEGMVRFIGISELIGGLGLLLPSILRVKPNLTPYAAIGLAVIMLFATIFHIMQGETSVIAMPIIFMVMAVFVAWGRSKRVPILAR
ncbi:MAG: DoxX family protein [Saprospiraceae bacterium]|nr:DoxX family protein [Saprospiraceae bacterium]